MPSATTRAFSGTACDELNSTGPAANVIPPPEAWRNARGVNVKFGGDPKYGGDPCRARSEYDRRLNGPPVYHAYGWTGACVWSVEGP
jgi:hypothetical protein